MNSSETVVAICARALAVLVTLLTVCSSGNAQDLDASRYCVQRAHPQYVAIRTQTSATLSTTWLLEGDFRLAARVTEKADGDTSNEAEPPADAAPEVKKSEPKLPPPEGKTHFGLRAGVLVPINAKIKKLDPFWGGGIYLRTKGENLFFQASFDVYAGRGVLEETTYDYSTGQTTTKTSTFTDLLFSGMVGIGVAIPLGPDKNGQRVIDSYYSKHGALYFSGCVGLIYEYAKAGDWDKDVSGIAFPIDVRVGYTIGIVDISTGVMFLPGSGNVTALWGFSIGILF